MITLIGKRRILIVEDNADIADLLVIRLELAGYKTCVAKDGFKALACVVEFQPNAILLDIGLPGKDGFEVLKALASHPKTRLIPVLMLTAREAMSDIKQALALGAKDYVIKPFDDQKLLMRVARLFGGMTVKTTREKTAFL